MRYVHPSQIVLPSSRQSNDNDVQIFEVQTGNVFDAFNSLQLGETNLKCAAQLHYATGWVKGTNLSLWMGR